MSQSQSGGQVDGVPGFLTRNVGPGPARERLHQVMNALTRARRLQVLVDHGFAGLLAGLVLATVAVLLARLMHLPYSPWQLAGAAVVVALAVAFLAGWWRRPDTLDVAIRADLALRLKQRLSTAWEYVTLHGEDELAGRLAVQAVKAGLPARASIVFPLRINRWGWLAPLAAVALLLAGIADIKRVQGPAPRALDEQVVGVGQRLGEFGREMQARAERDKLPRSARQAAEIERLGARMESGTLARGQALEQLRRLGVSLDQERNQALREAAQSGGGDPGSRQRAERSPTSTGLNPDAMLDRLRRRALDNADTRALAQRLDDLERFGIPRRELENALERHRAGADEALREILENLARIERARKEDEELGNASAQVRRAQDALGDARARTRGDPRRRADMDWDDEDREVRGDVSADAKTRAESGIAGRDARGASQAGSGIATERQDSPFSPDAGRAERVLTPQGQEREGEVHTAKGRILPKSNRPRVENVEMKAEFATQVEEVLSREHYPAHYKEFVRRYFLSLSRGARPAPEQPSAREETRER